MKNTIYFEPEWLDIINDLPAGDRALLTSAIVNYQITGQQPELDPYLNALFRFVKLALDRRAERLARHKKQTASSEKLHEPPRPDSLSTVPAAKDSPGAISPNPAAAKDSPGAIPSNPVASAKDNPGAIPPNPAAAKDNPHATSPKPSDAAKNNPRIIPGAKRPDNGVSLIMSSLLQHAQKRESSRNNT